MTAESSTLSWTGLTIKLISDSRESKTIAKNISSGMVAVCGTGMLAITENETAIRIIGLENNKEQIDPL